MSQPTPNPSDPEDLDWKDLNSDAFAHYTAYGSCGSAPWE